MKYEDVPSAKSFPGLPIEEPVNSFYTEGIYVGYRYYETFNVPVAYEFGYGLSYTTFEYTNLKLSTTDFVDITSHQRLGRNPVHHGPDRRLLARNAAEQRRNSDVPAHGHPRRSSRGRE